MPKEEDAKMKYYPGKYEFKKPFTIYYDFECALKKVEEKKTKNTGESYTAVTEEHVPTGFCIYGNSHTVYSGNPLIEERTALRYSIRR